MARFKMDLHITQSGCTRLVACRIVVCLLLVSYHYCGSQRVSEEKELKGFGTCADIFRAYLVDIGRMVTGPDILKEVKGMSVAIRTSDNMAAMLDDVIRKMERLLKKKEAAVEALKNAAENAMQHYGPYKEVIDFKDVEYINAKEVVVEKDLVNMDPKSRKEIEGAINYLPTEPTWNFKPEKNKPQLNKNTSSIHVPTNIYDKSTTILNGVQWTTNLTNQFIANSNTDPALTWQYFCSSDGIFRIYPGMQWPRESDQVDTFDCRIRRWYIQTASYPKNILILLDSSGSMKGLRFVIARSTVNKILETLSDEDYFNVMQFYSEPRYVDECFNDTLMTASADNIKRMQTKIEVLEAKNYSNFEKALTKAFQLFKKEQMEFKGHSLCNKAIMIITDGAPENFDSVFSEFNWPEKSVRVFTFLIGKEVPDNRQTRWMACANKGKFTHISTRADVQENVQKYIKVLSRPLALKKAKHKVWSAVYLDFVTGKSDIRVPAGRPEDLNMDFDDISMYEGLGLIMTLSMPVFDYRTKVGPGEEEPDLLGVVGTDMRIHELMKFIPTYQLGVNGYAFAITNHGYVLFHPDYRPFYSEKRGLTTHHLKVKPKYNSVELSQVELTASSEAGWNRENPLRSYLLMSKSGGDNISVLTHSDGMKRARKTQKRYQFKEVADTFKLVFVVPDGYGSRYIKVDPATVLPAEELKRRENGTNYYTDLANWIYCWDDKNYTWIQMDIHTVIKNLGAGFLDEKCEKEHMYRLLKDWELTWTFAKTWEERVSRYMTSERDKQFINAIGKIWIGTSSGLTRSLDVNAFDVDSSGMNTQTIKSVYYKRAVDGWQDGYTYIFSGPVVATQKELNFNTSIVTMSTAVIIGSSNSTPVPAAVVALNMRYSAFYEKFILHTFNCSDSSCSCNDTEHFSCYLVDNNGYILATNNLGRNGTGMLLGQHNGRLMRALLDDNIYTQLNLTDYQSICQTPVRGEQWSASSFVMNPLKLIARVIVWLVSEVVLFLSEWNIISLLRSSSVCGHDGGECSGWIPEEIVRYLCGFVIDASTGHKVLVAYVTSTDSCVKNMTRYVLNLNALVSKRKRHLTTDCLIQCASSNMISYEAHWLNETNLVFVVMDTSCICNDSDSVTTDSTTGSKSSNPDSRFVFSVKAKEVHYDDSTQCRHLRNFSDELKHVDVTRNTDTFCLDSSNETASVCSKSPALIYSHQTSNAPVYLTVLLLLMAIR